MYPLGAWLAAENDLAALDEVKTQACQQPDARQVSFVGDPEHAGDARCREKQLDRLADGAPRKAATLRRRLQREANLARRPVFRQMKPNVANKRISLRLGDSELYPLARREERRAMHLVEKRQRIGVGHW